MDSGRYDAAPPVLHTAPPGAMTDSDKAKSERAKNANLAVRVATAAVTVPFILWALLAAPLWVWASFVLVIAIPIGAQELFAMTLPGERGLQAWGIVATAGIGALSYFESTGLNTTGVPAHVGFLIIVLASLLVAIARPQPSETAGFRMAWLAGGPLYIGGTVSALASMHALEYGGQWVLLSMMLAWFADTLGYFSGRFLGGKVFGARKMSPNISPNKTWEGAVGGVAGSTLAVLLAHFWYLPTLPLVGGLLLAWIAGPLGILGDLVESLIKRATGTKDSGWIVPGHGGLIDRIDALMFTGTATFIYARYIL
jgi:phosphatidate cytidylyltransferase